MDNKQRALFIVNSLAGGGAERVCLRLASELMKSMTVDIVTFSSKQDYAIPKGINHFSLGVESDIKKIKTLSKLFTAVPKLNRFVKEQEKKSGYTIVTSHLPVSHMLTKLSVLKRNTLYVVHYSMGVYLEKRSIIYRLVSKLIYRKQKIIAVSEGAKRELIEAGLAKESDVNVIYNPVEIEEYTITARAREASTNMPKRPFLLFVGRLAASKRPDRMVEVFLSGKFSEEYDLVFLGEGPSRLQVEDLIEEYNLSNHVHLMGFVNEPKEWMRAAEVVVCTSDTEAFPVTLIEALSVGAKVVSSDCRSGPNEILVDSLSRFLVQPDDIQGYVTAINSAINNYPVLESGYFEKYSTSKIAEEYQRAFNEMICSGS